MPHRGCTTLLVPNFLCIITSSTGISWFIRKMLSTNFTVQSTLLGMTKCVPSNQQVEISSDDSSSSDADNDISRGKQPNEEPFVELSSEAWLFRQVKSYQEYMKMIPIPPKRGTLIPFTSWVGLGSSIKQLYGQPLHYLTNIHLKRLDQERVGAEDEDVPLDMIIHPLKAEASIWLIEEVHRLSSSPHHLARLWNADPMYHAFIDSIFPKLDHSVKPVNRKPHF